MSLSFSSIYSDLLLLKNKEAIFVKIIPRIDKMLNFQNWVSFNQITYIYIY